MLSASLNTHFSLFFFFFFFFFLLLVVVVIVVVIVVVVVVVVILVVISSSNSSSSSSSSNMMIDHHCISGMGPMPWTINSEIYPLWARSVGTSVATFTNWTVNLAVSMSFLSLTEALTRYGLYCR